MTLHNTKIKKCLSTIMCFICVFYTVFEFGSSNVSAMKSTKSNYNLIENDPIELMIEMDKKLGEMIIREEEKANLDKKSLDQLVEQTKKVDPHIKEVAVLVQQRNGEMNEFFSNGIKESEHELEESRRINESEKSRLMKELNECKIQIDELERQIASYKDMENDQCTCCAPVDNLIKCWTWNFCNPHLANKFNKRFWYGFTCGSILITVLLGASIIVITILK